MNGVSIAKEFLATGRRPGNVVFDLDGVVFLGPTTIPGSGDALAALEAAGVSVAFATNNATKTVAQVTERIETGTGFSPTSGSVVTSAVATAAMLEPADDPVLVVGGPGLPETLTEAGRRLTDDPTLARSVVVGLDRGISYDKIHRAASAVRDGARFVATNTDVTFPTPTGPSPGAGSIVAAIEAASGRRPEVAGKPHAPMVRSVRATLAPGPTWVVGDRPETDLALARQAGWVAVLVLTGVTQSVDEVSRELTPDMTLESIRDLAAAFSQ